MARPGLPGDTDRLAVIGRTGSGKTQAAVWHLSRANWLRKPWYVLDFKGDGLIADIPRAKEVDIKDKPTRHAGIYILRPRPDQTDEVEEFLWKIWNNQNTGLYVDEGYMLGLYNAPFRALLTQGRSRHIPMIVLSQRPVFLDKFVWSEAGYYQIFHLNNDRDNRVVREFVPANVKQRLPTYHSWYYDVSQDQLVVLRPVPDRDTILETFRDRVKMRKSKV